MDVAEPGDQFEVRGPIGGWFVWDAADGGPLLLVGGGSGVVPLMAMARHRAAAGSDAPTRLLLSSRSWEDVIYRDELDALAARGDGFEVVHTLTRSQPDGWQGYARRVDHELLARGCVAGRFGRARRSCAARPRSWRRSRRGSSGSATTPARVKTERFGATGGVR